MGNDLVRPPREFGHQLTQEHGASVLVLLIVVIILLLR
jgi:hypothetical protein